MKVSIVIAISLFAVSCMGILHGESTKPNIILIMADDLGAEGVNPYGSTIYTTPHLDRMDLSHHLLGGEGKGREHVFIAYKGEQYFLRDREYRLSIGGKKKVTEELFHIPTNSLETRYSEKSVTVPKEEKKRAMKKLMDPYLAIRDEYEAARKSKKK